MPFIVSRDATPWGEFKQPKPASRNVAALLNDTVITTVNSGLGIVKGISDFVSVDNPLSRGLEYIIKEGEENQSDIVKQSEAELGQAMDEGGFEAVKGVGKYVLSSPVQTAAKIVGGFGPIGKAVKYSTMGAKAYGLGARGQGIAGLGTGATLGGAAAGGDAASDAYDQVMNSPNIPEDQRESMARQAARQASVVPAILGGLSGATGLERIMSGARGITREGIRRTAGKEFLTEGIEEGGTKASANIAAMQYDPTIDPMRGVVGAATLGGIMGAGGGGGVAYLNNRAYESNILGTANPTADQTTMLGINPGANLSTQDLINVQTGVTPAATKAQLAAREADIKAALDEPSGRYVADENGIERELSMGEAASLGYETPALGTLTSAEAPSGETTSQVIGDDLQAAASKVGLSLVGSRGKPNVKRIEAFTKAVDLLGSGAIDRVMFDQTIEQLKKGRYAEATKSFAQVEADFQEKQRIANQPKFQRAPKPEDQNVSTDVSATGGLAPSVATGGPDVQGSVASTGPALTSGPVADVGSRVAGISPAGNETSLLGNVSGQPATPVVSRKKRITFEQPQQGQAFVAPETTTEQDQGLPAEQPAQTSLEDQLALGELTGNTAEAQALTEEEAGQRMDVTDTDASRAQDINAILDKAFEGSEDKARDIEIAKMYLEVMKSAPQGFKQKIQTAIGEQFGVKAGAVRKIGQTPALVDAAVSMGMTRQQALDLLEISDTSKNKVSTTAGEQAGGLETVATELGVDFQENDSIGFGYDDTRTWSQSVKGAGDTVNATDEALANAIYTLSEKVNSVGALADKLPAIAGTLREMKAKLEETLAKTLQSVAGRLKPGSKPAPQKTTAQEVAEDETKLLTAEQVALAKEQEARLATRAASRKGLEVGDTVQNPKLGTGTVQSFSGDGDATMAKIAFQSGQTKDLMLAVAKLEKVASAPVTEKAPAAEAPAPKKTRAGKAKAQVTGRDVWENLQKDTPGLGDYDGLSKNEKEYVEEVAARTNGDFTLVSEPSMEVVIDNHLNEEQTEDIYTEDFEADDGTALRMVRGDTIEVTAGTLKFTGTAETLENLRRYEGVNAAIRRYENDDANSVVDKVELWLLAPNTVDFDAAVMTVQGKRTVAVRRGVLLNTSKAEYSIHHELGHIADEALATGGVFSGHEDMNLDVKNNVVKAYGPVAKEVLDFYNANPNSSLSKQLAYPLNRAKHGKLSTNETRFELFAQLWAIYNDPDGRSSLDESLPKTYQFIEDAYEAQKQSPDRTVQSAVTETPAGAQAVTDNRGAQGGVRVEKLDAPKVLKLKTNKEKILNSAAAETVSEYTRKAINALVYSQDLFKRAANVGIGSAKKMGEVYRQRQNFEGAIEKESQRVAQLYGFIPKQEQRMGPGSANDVLKDMTLAGKWGFKPVWRTGDMANVVPDGALEKRFDKLSPQAQRWIKETIKNGDESLQLKQKTITEAVNSEYDILIKAAQKDGDIKKVSQLQADKRSQLKKFERLFSVDATKPFAPLTRYGNYVVVANSKAYENASKEQKAKMENDPDHHTVTFVESMLEAVKLKQKLKDEGLYQKVESFEKEAGREDMYGGLMKAFNQLSSSLDAELANATDIEDRNTLARARGVIADLYLSSLAENSARKAEMRRKGIAGEIDMLRSFATRGRANAQFLATVKYTPQLTETINEMRREVKQGGRSIEKSQMFNEIMARHNQSMSYDDSTMNDFIAKITRGTTIWMLATSPMYYLQNLTQPVMLSIPYMAQRHNYLKAQKSLFKAYGELGGLIKNSRIDEAFNFDNVPKDVRTMISTLVDRQQIDIGMEAELGKFELTGDSAVARGITKADRILRTAAQKVEALNRVATAMAAYRMELAKTGNIKQATEYASEVIDETHGNFNRLNAPRIFNTTFGRLALQFRKFQLLNGTALIKMVHNATVGETKEVRTAAREGLKFIFAHTAILTGLVGTPGFAAMAFLAKSIAAVFGEDEEPYNLEKEIYESLVNQFGEDAATMIMRGTPTLAGVDVSGKIGMGNVLSILPFTDFELSKAGVSDVGFALAFGATGSVAQRFAEGANLISGGEYYRGLEKLAPKGFADALKAMRESDEGVTRLNGDVLVPAEEIEGLKSFAKGLGIPVIADTQRRFLTDVKFEEEKAFKDKAAKLKNQYTKARREGEDTEAIRDKWVKLQEERVREGFKREPLSNLLQAPQAQAKRERETTGGIQFNKQTRRFTEELVGEQ